MPNVLIDTGNEVNPVLTGFRFRLSIMLSLCCFNKMLTLVKLFVLV